MYYPREEKLVSLDMLKLYHGEDVIRQDPEDIDPDRWLDKSKLTELPEAPLGEAEMRSQELFLDQRSPDQTYKFKLSRGDSFKRRNTCKNTGRDPP